MPAKFTVSDHGDVTIIKMIGRATWVEGAKELYQHVSDQVDRGRTKIVLDMSNVNYIDSGGLGYLVTAYAKVANKRGILVVADLTPRLRDSITNSTLGKVMRMYDSVDNAIAGLKKTST